MMPKGVYLNDQVISRKLLDLRSTRKRVSHSLDIDYNHLCLVLRGKRACSLHTAKGLAILFSCDYKKLVAR